MAQAWRLWAMERNHGKRTQDDLRWTSADYPTWMAVPRNVGRTDPCVTNPVKGTDAMKERDPSLACCPIYHVTGLEISVAAMSECPFSQYRNGHGGSRLFALHIPLPLVFVYHSFRRFYRVSLPWSWQRRPPPICFGKTSALKSPGRRGWQSA